MVESCSEVSDLMVELLCKGGCSDKECAESDGMDGGPWSHSKLMDCIRKKWKTLKERADWVERLENFESINFNQRSMALGMSVAEFREMKEKANKSDEHYRAMREFQERNSNQAQIRDLKKHISRKEERT